MTRSLLPQPTLQPLMLLALLIAALGACSVASRAPAAPAATRAASASAGTGVTGAVARDSTRRGYAGADVRFMQRMIAHHGQALAMTELVPARAGRDEVRLVAERIQVSQKDEIALMQRWLRERGEPVPAADPHGTGHDTAGMGAHAGGMHGQPGDDRQQRQQPLMPGMLTREELARLAAASGSDFDRLFLQFMIRHHEGAIEMVAQLLASKGAAQEPEVFRLASDVDADQRAEIARMRALLGTL